MSRFSVVMLPGFLGGPADWRYIGEQLSGDHNVEPVDLWSHGSGWQAADGWLGLKFHLLDMIRSKPKPVVLVGYSLGGRLVLQLLPDLMNDLAGAVLVSTHPGIMSKSEVEERRTRDQYWRDLLLKSESQFLAEWNQQSVFFGSQIPERNWQQLDKAKLVLAFTELSVTDLGAPVASQLEARAPLAQLWLAGENDLRYCELYAQAGIGFTVIRGAGHRIWADQPAALAEHIRQFLNEVAKRHV